MSQQFTIWCPPLLRDQFDDYCNLAAGPVDRKRATEAFEAFHELLSGGVGPNPPIRYASAPPIPQSAVDVEIKIHGVRFCISVDFHAKFAWLFGINP